MKFNTFLLILITSLQLAAGATPPLQALKARLKAANPKLSALQIEYTYHEKGGILKLCAPGELSNLKPLADTTLSITHLNIANNGILSDLSPLADLPLTKLEAHGNSIADLSPLSSMKLEYLSLGGNKRIHDLTPLSKLPLKELYLPGTNVANLLPLKNMNLKVLWLTDTKVRSLKPIAACPIEHIAVSGEQTPFFYQLNTKGLKKLTIFDASELSWIKGLKVECLDISKCPAVKSLHPVMQCPNLKKLHIKKVEYNLEFLKEHPVLQTVTWFENGHKVFYDLEKKSQKVLHYL